MHSYTCLRWAQVQHPAYKGKATKLLCCVLCRFTASVKEVASSSSLGLLLNTTSAFQYIDLNCGDGLFTGYAWSLDTFVDYCYFQLGALSTVMTILLVLEVCARLK